jgi:hypothetical protein
MNRSFNNTVRGTILFTWKLRQVTEDVAQGNKKTPRLRVRGVSMIAWNILTAL